MNAITRWRPGGAPALLWLLAAVSCAGGGGLGWGAGGPGAQAFQSLSRGDAEDAQKTFARAGKDSSPEFLFAQATLAWARGRDPEALDATLKLLRQAGETGETGDTAETWTAQLATAVVGRLPALLATATDPRPVEDQLLALPIQQLRRLPWQARVALEEALDQLARRRGDAGLLAALPARTDCLADVTLLGSVGRLPHLDLLAPLVAGGPPARRIEVSGCRLTVPAREGVPGVRALQVQLEVPVAAARGGAGHHLVIDFAGPAALRVDGGPWQRHGSLERYGPRTSALVPRIPPGKHRIEVRIGTWGAPTALRLFVFPPGMELPSRHGHNDRGRAVMGTMAEALIAEQVGEVDRMLEAVGRLRALPRFALGLATAAALTALDPTRPAALSRDQAQALYRQAVAIDPSLARVFLELGRAELAGDQPAEAVELAEQARKAAPGWWPAAALAVEALRARGFDHQADEVLTQALAALDKGEGGCRILQLAHDRAQLRHRVNEENALARRLARCDAQTGSALDRLRRQGDLTAAAALAQRQLGFTSDQQGGKGDLAALKLGLADPAGAARLLQDTLEVSPADAGTRVRLADAWRAAGRDADARALLADTVRRFPGRESIRQVASIAGLALPLDRFRQPGKDVIADYQRSKRDYDAPAVLVLDRTVMRVLPDGTQAILTHNIVNVKTKDGIARWGEVQIPEAAEILALRTHKPDGSIREAEEIAGKSTISAPELVAGDFVEWETVEYREPAEGFSPGFLGDRFFFQSVELPLHLSELLVVVPQQLPLQVDARAGAPQAEQSEGPEPGTRSYRFLAREMPQLFAEPAAVPHIEWIPSVRVSSGLQVQAFARLMAERLTGISRGSPALREVARQIAATARQQKQPLGPAILAWVTEHIESQGGGGGMEAATGTLARRRGNRAALVVALARALGLKAELALARSPAIAPAEAPVLAEELDDFGDLLVRFGDGPRVQYVDPRWRHAPFGYLPPSLDGAVTLRLPGGQLERARSTIEDRRTVTVDVRLAADGTGQGTVIERLQGLPAIEWAEAKKRTGEDESKLRQDFEQRWLGNHFPGARLGGLVIDVDPARPGQAQLRYSFAGAQLATASGGALELSPSFFQSQVGRRFATERRRRTGLVVGVDTPLQLSARLVLPPGARLLDTGASAALAAGPGQAIQLSERRERKDVPDAPAVWIERQVRVPLVRIAPADYDKVATELRRMDRLEEAEIRFALGDPRR